MDVLEERAARPNARGTWGRRPHFQDLATGRGLAGARHRPAAACEKVDAFGHFELDGAEPGLDFG